DCSGAGSASCAVIVLRRFVALEDFGGGEMTAAALAACPAASVAVAANSKLGLVTRMPGGGGAGLHRRRAS
ncbi:MAG: hypothetical protein ACXWJT_06600, partial [Xanthobacteraceae bacterium]